MPSKGFLGERKRIEALAYAGAAAFGHNLGTFSVKKGDRDGSFSVHCRNGCGRGAYYHADDPKGTLYGSALTAGYECDGHMNMKH